MRKHHNFPFLCLLTGLTAIAAALPANAQLAAHRAVYDIELKESSERSGVSGVRGRMVIELTGGTCEGWTVAFRLVNQYLLRRGKSRLADNRSSSWESADGDKLRYSQRQYINNRLEEETLLKVDRTDDTGVLGGRMSKPNEQEFKLPADAIFPVQHQVRLVDAAKSGLSRDRSIVFDGSEGAKAYIAVSFIGKPLQDFKQAGQGASALSPLKAWPISISYFSTDAAAKEETPVYQVRFRMFENGVAGDLILDYGNFILEGKLANYEALPTADCN